MFQKSYKVVEEPNTVVTPIPNISPCFKKGTVLGAKLLSSASTDRARGGGTYTPQTGLATSRWSLPSHASYQLAARKPEPLGQPN